MFWQGVELLDRIKVDTRISLSSDSAIPERSLGYIAIFTRNCVVLEWGFWVAL